MNNQLLLKLLKYAKSRLVHPDRMNYHGFTYIGDTPYPPPATSKSARIDLENRIKILEEWEFFSAEIDKAIKELENG